MTLLVPNCVNLGRIVNRGGALRLALLAALLVPFANLGGLYRVGLPSALACSAGAEIRGTHRLDVQEVH